mmetsp:Transcript_6277/g.15182  ORF Transcript_6277/g.15182 Transcript_6277/m.15182 type:complete len:274 (-) Transcript_6277:460-1281(-)
MSAPSSSLAWRELLEALEPYAQLTGWRYDHDDFMRLDDPKASAELRAAREHGVGAVLEFGDGLLRLAKEPPAVQAASPLLQEFELAQRKVAREAVYKTMCATCRALGVWEDAGAGLDDPEESCAFQDLTQPFETIARRLKRFEKHLDAVPGAREERERRLLDASLIVEFALEHGFTWSDDEVSSSMLIDFMQRVKEWGGNDVASAESVRALVRGSVPEGPAKEPLQITALKWVEAHPAAAIGIGLTVSALTAAIAGVAIAGIASAASRGNNGR